MRSKSIAIADQVKIVFTLKLCVFFMHDNVIQGNTIGYVTLTLKVIGQTQTFGIYLVGIVYFIDNKDLDLTWSFALVNLQI